MAVNGSKYSAIVMAAGKGLRMGGSGRKQFTALAGLPVVVHSLLAFQRNNYIDKIVIVIPEGFDEYVRDLCKTYGITKLHAVVHGGDQRFRSVHKGLNACPKDTDYVLIHDGVRPMITNDVIDRCCRFVMITRACVAAVPLKDTIKRGNLKGYVEETLDRSTLWSIQTPQAFSFRLLMQAYDRLFKTIEEYHPDESLITDDAVIVENMTGTGVRLVLGDYQNIKLTTPEDMIVAEAFMASRKNQENA